MCVHFLDKISIGSTCVGLPLPKGLKIYNIRCFTVGRAINDMKKHLKKQAGRTLKRSAVHTVNNVAHATHLLASGGLTLPLAFGHAAFDIFGSGMTCDMEKHVLNNIQRLQKQFPDVLVTEDYSVVPSSVWEACRGSETEHRRTYPYYTQSKGIFD